VGFFSGLFLPRSVRRAAHPGRAVKRAVTPKPIKQARRAMHPIDHAVYSAQRSVATSIRSGRRRKAPVYRHGKCPVNTVKHLIISLHINIYNVVPIYASIHNVVAAARVT
jgi:hypothetical protein